jgi:hypothetical protein
VREKNKCTKEGKKIGVWMFFIEIQMASGVETLGYEREYKQAKAQAKN